LHHHAILVVITAIISSYDDTTTHPSTPKQHAVRKTLTIATRKR
jgi:hypothetical protein